jgi:transcription elongation factor Elf1
MPDQLPAPCDITPNCPICEHPNSLTLASRHLTITICVCQECGTTLSVPDAAMDAFVKRQRPA